LGLRSPCGRNKNCIYFWDFENAGNPLNEQLNWYGLFMYIYIYMCDQAGRQTVDYYGGMNSTNGMAPQTRESDK
jgi:hypothetical protein